MADKYVSVRNLKFLFFEVLKAHELNRFEYYKDYDRESCEMSMDAAKQIGDTHLFPIYTDMDKNKAVFEDGVVKVHPKLKSVIQALAEGGGISALEKHHEDYL